MTKVERQKEWEARIAAYRASEQRTKEWCEAYGFNPQQLRYWLRLESKKADVTPPSKWIPMDVSDG